MPPPPSPALGVSFSHRHASWLGLDPADTLRALLADAGVRWLRLSLYWDEVAPAAGSLDFAPLRPWLELAAVHGARVLMTLGIKAQRHPEFYPPAWLVETQPLPHGADLVQHGRVVTMLLLMLERATAFLADYDVIEAWQVENEPFVPSPRWTAGWRISPGLLEREIAVVREVDPRRRPVVVNHVSRSAFDCMWPAALRPADALAQNLYTHRASRPGRPWRYWNDYVWGPFSPRLGRQSWLAHRLGKQFWITELQAEPWEQQDIRTMASEEIGSISPERIRRNLALARRAAPDRIYLWGAEWWRYMAEQRGDDQYWELARKMFRQEAGD